LLYYRDKDNSENESAKEDEQVYCTVRADEIPEEPGKSFLMRDFEEPQLLSLNSNSHYVGHLLNLVHTRNP